MIRQYPSLLHRHFLEHSHSEMAGEEKLLKASRLRFIFHMTPINIFLFFLPFVFARLLIPLNSGAFGENNFVPLSYLTKPGWDQRVYSIICLWYGRRASIKVPVILSHLSPRLAQSHTHLYFFIIYFIVSASLSRAFCVKHFFPTCFLTPYPHRIEYYTQFRFRFLFFSRLAFSPSVQGENRNDKILFDFSLLHIFIFTFCIGIMIKLFASVWRTFCGNCVCGKSYKSAFECRSIKIASGVLCLSRLLHSTSSSSPMQGTISSVYA